MIGINSILLLPCPFCGSTDLIIDTDYAEDDDHRAYAHHVFCSDCHARGRNQYPISWCETPSMAIDAWNDRFVPATISNKNEERVQISTTALIHINGELERIVQIKNHIKSLLTPINMVK